MYEQGWGLWPFLHRNAQRAQEYLARAEKAEKAEKADPGSFRSRILTWRKFVRIPAGEFEMGDGGHSDCPRHRVWLDAYDIGVYCVTNAEYGQFVQTAAHRPPNNDRWNNPSYADHPVTDVSWDDARAYAEWARCELPTEAQWEKAARGPQGYVYPWGNEWNETKCHNSAGSRKEGTAPVDAYPEGVSGYGTYQQSGNVWEWCRDWYDGASYTSPDAARNPEGPPRGSRRVCRGGSWWSGYASFFRGAYRNRDDPSIRSGCLGFRLVRRA